MLGSINNFPLSTYSLQFYSKGVVIGLHAIMPNSISLIIIYCLWKSHVSFYSFTHSMSRKYLSSPRYFISKFSCNCLLTSIITFSDVCVIIINWSSAVWCGGMLVCGWVLWVVWMVGGVGGVGCNIEKSWFLWNSGLVWCCELLRIREVAAK